MTFSSLFSKREFRDTALGQSGFRQEARLRRLDRGFLEPYYLARNLGDDPCHFIEGKVLGSQ